VFPTWSPLEKLRVTCLSRQIIALHCICPDTSTLKVLTRYLPRILRPCSSILSLCLLTSSSCFLTSSLCLRVSNSCCLFIWYSSPTKASLSISMDANSSLWRRRVASMFSCSLARPSACRSYSSAIADLLDLLADCECDCGWAIMTVAGEKAYLWWDWICWTREIGEVWLHCLKWQKYAVEFYVSGGGGGVETFEVKRLFHQALLAAGPYTVRVM